MGKVSAKFPIKRMLGGFAKARSGSVAITVGLMLPMALVAAGGTIDYANAVKTTHAGQRAMDAAVLALAKRNVDSDKLQAEGEKMFAGILEERRLDKNAFNVSFKKVGDGVRGKATMRKSTYFLGLIGLDKIEGAVDSSATPPLRTPLEISLVLDVSGSMDEDLNGAPRIERMRTAVNGMLDKLETDLASKTSVSVALVPYSSSVNITGVSGVLAATSVGGQSPFGGDVWAAERVVSAAGTSYTVDDASGATRAIPFVTAGEMNSAEPNARITPLTTNLGTVRTAVAAMAPDGWTAGHLGMAWGLYSISDKWASVWPNAPKAYGSAEKVIVFLSDGEFNTTHNIGDISASQKNKNFAESDAYFKNICDLAETKGVVIYMVALNLDPVSEAKLGECAANGGKLYPATSASDLSGAFNDIARRLGRLRLTS